MCWPRTWRAVQADKHDPGQPKKMLLKGGDVIVGRYRYPPPTPPGAGIPCYKSFSFIDLALFPEAKFVISLELGAKVIIPKGLTGANFALFMVQLARPVVKFIIPKDLIAKFVQSKDLSPPSQRSASW
jgi:hypothetical protein